MILPPLPIWLHKESILVLGDSHAGVFNNQRFRWYLPRTRFDLCIVGGATVSGLHNPKSRTQAARLFEDSIGATSPSYIITLLGEVDVGFVIWYRAQKYRQSLTAMLDMAVSNYGVLLRRCRQRAPVIAISAPLPTIQDGQDWGEVADLRKEIAATLSDRTTLTLQFNKGLKDIAMESGCAYLDLDAECLGSDGLLAKHFLNESPLDHHYCTDAYARLLAPKLTRILRNNYARRAA